MLPGHRLVEWGEPGTATSRELGRVGVGYLTIRGR
jgi:hypothetical protein